MPLYHYRARDLTGAMTAGEVYADDEAGLRAHLRDSRLFLVGFRKSLDNGPQKAHAPIRRKRVKLQVLAVASRQLATLVRAGLPIIETLATLRAQVDDKTLAGALAEMQSDVLGGTTLSEAMAKHPKIFNRLCVALVAAGEAGGLLDQTLDIMAEQLDKESLIQQQIKAAMAYPKLVMVACAGVVAFMLTFIVPIFAKMYEQFHAELPFMTKLLVSVSDFITKSWWAAIIIVVLLGKAYRKAMTTKAGERFFDTVALRAPVFGPIMRKIAIARFAQTFAGLTKSGVPILNALAICAETSGNIIIQNAILEVAGKVSQGAPIAASMEESKEFPTMVTRMIAAGEKSGNMDEMLSEIAKFYNRDVDFAIGKMTKLMEPAMTIIVGGVVLVVMLALYMPVFNMGQVLKR